MNENSFYLIHKAMNWVDEWGSMNEDEIDALIAKLETQKQQLAKVTNAGGDLQSPPLNKGFVCIYNKEAARKGSFFKL